jgi:hypothetical protein
MSRKSGKRLPVNVVFKQKAGAERFFEEKSSRSAVIAPGPQGDADPPMPGEVDVR